MCSWNIDRKRTTQDKEKFQISENLYRDDLYQKNNDIYTNAIRTCIEEKKGVAIVLGAGVSKEQGAKTWDELLRRFFRKLAGRVLQQLSYAKMSGQMRKPLLGKSIKAYMIKRESWM